MSFFDTTPMGQVLTRVGTDMERVDFDLPDICFDIIRFVHKPLLYTSTCLRVFSLQIHLAPLTCIFRCLFWTITNYYVMFYAMPALIPVSLLCVFYFQFINNIFTPAKRGYERLSSKNKAPIYSHFQESILGQSTIRAFKKTDEFTVKERLVHNLFSICYIALPILVIYLLFCEQF